LLGKLSIREFEPKTYYHNEFLRYYKLPDAESIPLPVEKSDDILLDTMIIHEILVGDDVVKKLQKRLREYDSKLILLDRVGIEAINMEKKKYNRIYTYDEIEEAVKKTGPYEIIQVDHAHPEIIKAKDLSDNGMNLGQDYEDLSYADCILLRVHLTHVFLTRPASLLTRDNALGRVAKSEGRKSISTSASYTWKTIYSCPGCHTEHTRGGECPNCATQLKIKEERKYENGF